MPFDFALPNATIVYKNAIDNKSNFIKGEKLINNFSNNYKINGHEIISNSKSLMLESLVEFMEFHNKNILERSKTENLPKVPKNSIYARYNLRISQFGLNIIQIKNNDIVTMKTLTKILSLLNKVQTKNFYYLLFLMVIGMLLEVISISSIIPLLTLISDPTQLDNTIYINYLLLIKNFSVLMTYLV